MKLVFADTLYWIALFVPGDSWSEAASAVDLSGASLVTTEEVLSEFLTAVSSRGERTRRLRVWLSVKYSQTQALRLSFQSRESFLAGLYLYEKRPDKEYSLADCISMNVMRQKQIQEILTHDRHFSQEGVRPAPGSANLTLCRVSPDCRNRSTWIWTSAAA